MFDFKMGPEIPGFQVLNFVDDIYYGIKMVCTV